MKKYSLAIAFIIMLAGGVALSYVYNERPERVVGEAIRTLRDARSFMAAVTVGTFAPEAVVRAAGGDPNLVLLPIVFVGEVGMNLPADKPPSGTATFELIGQDKDGKEVTFHVVTGQDGTSYVQFENIPEEKTSAKVVEQLNGKWYSMRTRGLAALLAKDGEATAEQEDPTGKPAAEAWARVRETVSSGELFGRPVAEGTQLLGSVSATKYELPLKHDVLVRVAQDIKTMVRGRTLTPDELSAVALTMQDRDVSLQIWAERKSKRLLQANLDVKTLGLDPGDKEPKTTLLSLLVRFTSWNEPVDVQIPQDSQPFGDLIERLKAKK
ncbi:MAG TPA: hypothetical protein VL500_00710 [Candidatus Eisenbacteria bacterium]|nr:hypothetical protein [Candidatus Eisenbacteria bacterium]